MDIKSRALEILKPTAFVLGIICMGIVLLIHQSHVAYGMESGVEKHLPNPAAFKHFEEDKDLIHKYLSNVKEAELHFFWTTGRTLIKATEFPDKFKEYKATRKIDVGGKEYGQKIFPYIDWLLKITPNNFIVKFVCDAKTRVSNTDQVYELKEKYGARFKIIDIVDIEKKLVIEFPNKSKIINIVFKNATQGSPVLTSDIYRIIGMVYGHEKPSDITKSLFIYCDIDEFCYGMENSAHTKFIKALFNPVTKSPFYFGTSKDNNDLIKLKITDLQSYKNFCEQVLNNINIKSPVLTHFTKLHGLIKKCETVDSQTCSNIILQLPPPIHNLVEAVTATTGPQFLEDQNGVVEDLSYPDTTAMEWGSPEEALDSKMQRHLHTLPENILFWGYGAASAEEEKAISAFAKDCEQYRTVLSAAFYAKRFGDGHPFNIAIKQYLTNHFPYYQMSFKDLLKVNFAVTTKDIQKPVDNIQHHSSYNDWKEKAFKRITGDSKNHYGVLTRVLKQLEVEFPFTPESLDFQGH